jgi:myo-inositol-1(or 4)-monophosphatase
MVIEDDAGARLDLRNEVGVAADVARRALNLAKEMGGAAVSVKDGRDVVTGADIAVEELITGLLCSAFELPVVGEERGGDVPIDGTAYWLVDPICGTRNYASGIPLYCVNIAFVEHDDVVGAVVADASTDEIIVAERGRGAWALAGSSLRRVAVSDQSRTVVVEDGKSASPLRGRAAAFMAAFIRADRWDLRSFGTTLALPYLAIGRIAAYVVFTGGAPVHTAAGSLLVTEAGGILSDVDGHAWTLGSASLVAAATSELHEQLLDLAPENRR